MNWWFLFISVISTKYCSTCKHHNLTRATSLESEWKKIVSLVARVAKSKISVFKEYLGYYMNGKYFQKMLIFSYYGFPGVHFLWIIFLSRFYLTLATSSAAADVNTLNESNFFPDNFVFNKSIYYHSAANWEFRLLQ